MPGNKPANNPVCKSRCPECRRQCTAPHYATTGMNQQIGVVWTTPSVHGHLAKWTVRAGHSIHAWRNKMDGQPSKTKEAGK